MQHRSSSWTIGRKLAAAFLVLGLVLLVVGAVSTRGLFLGNAALQDLSKRRLPTVELLAHLRADNVEQISVLRTLALPGLSRADRDNLYREQEEHGAGMRTAVAGLARLDLDPESVAIRREITDQMAAWEQATTRAVALCREIDTHGIAHPVALAREVERFAKDHQAAVNRVQQLLYAGTVFDGGHDATACAFGRWLPTFTTDNADLRKQVAAMADSHREFHASIGRIRERFAAGEAAVAENDFQDRMMPAMQRVFAGFDAVLGRVDACVALERQLNELMLGPIERSRTALEGALGRLVERQEQAADAAADAGARTASQALWLGAVLTVAGLLGSTGLSVAIVRSLNRTLRGAVSTLGSGSGQIAAAASQVSAGSQTLAQGASEQAASLEEISSSLEELASTTRQNAGHAAEARTDADTARAAAERGAGEMRKMEQAMGEIRQSSIEVSKIIKTIDEIAFQTNILALNAAVEAARAGEAGAGFAVVADEVRSLAQRCAQAASETTTKISAATERSEQGVRLSASVAASLGEILEKSRDVDRLVAALATAAAEQSAGLAQVNQAVAQLDKVTQSNAASAEESASAAEELTAQSAELHGAADALAALVGVTASAEAAAPPLRPTLPADASPDAAGEPAAPDRNTPTAASFIG
jgi:methyl-accepting chemotaxis protein